MVSTVSILLYTVVLVYSSCGSAGLSCQGWLHGDTAPHPILHPIVLSFVQNPMHHDHEKQLWYPPYLRLSWYLGHSPWVHLSVAGPMHPTLLPNLESPAVNCNNGNTKFKSWTCQPELPMHLSALTCMYMYFDPYWCLYDGCFDLHFIWIRWPEHEWKPPSVDFVPCCLGKVENLVDLKKGQSKAHIICKTNINILYSNFVTSKAVTVLYRNARNVYL